MTLDLYIARRFIGFFSRVFAGFFAIMLAIGVIEELRRFASESITFSEAFALALFNTPTSIYQILPLIMILSAIALFLGLAKSSELVVIRSAGRSGLRFLAAPVLSALMIGAVVVAVLNPLMAATSRTYQERSVDQTRSGSVLSVSDAGLWLRQRSEAGQTVIQAQKSNFDGTRLTDVTFLTYDEAGALQTRISAPEALLEGGAWRVQGGKTWALNASNPERAAKLAPGPLSIETDLTPEKIADSFGSPQKVSIWDLPIYIKELEHAGFSGLSHRMWYNQEMAAPAFLAAMVLIAAGFTMRHARSGGSGPLILMAILCGFLIFFLRNFGQVLGENGQIPILLAAWSPPLVAIFLSVGLLLHLEDG